MPSLAAKTEKISSLAELADPVKQMINMMEKKVRNLEKRKIKLDNYRLDVKNGKELNEDQKLAVSKYDTVLSNLELAKEILKSLNAVVLETARQQKKLAKKEQLERQQYEIQRLQESFMFRHILSCFQNEDVRNDFLNGENGAIQLTSEQLSQLDQLYKLIAPGLPTDQADISSHFHALAENHIFLVEGKNKEILGVTYKVLKDLLQSIKDCKYFSRPSETVEEDGTSSEDMPEDEIVKNEEIPEVVNATSEDAELQPTEQCNVEESVNIAVVPAPAPVEEIQYNEVPQFQNGPLQEVLSSQSAFNFLQESQIDLDAPHMDPAVVAVHQMAPPPPATVAFAGNTYPTSPVEEKAPVSPSEDCDLSALPNQSPPVNPVPVLPSAIPRTPVLSSVALNSQQEFDPSHPIPTQTFTNQSFAVMQNMIMPQAYVPVPATMHHGPMPHIAPIPVVPGLSPPTTTGASVIPIPVPVAPVSVTSGDNQEEMEPKLSEAEETGKSSEDDTLATETESNSNNVSNEKNGENGYSSYRGGYRRGRGRGNNGGYFRGRQNNYNGRGGYQNNYYHDRNGYNGNFRRGNNNRGPRGGNGNNRGRGNYRTQASSQPPQQQQQQQQQQSQQ